MSEPIATIRASAWSELFDCAYRFYWKNIVGLRSPASGAAYLGTSIHAGTAGFDSARLRGEPIRADDAVDISVNKLHNPDEEVAWDSDVSMSEVEQSAIALTARYCTDMAPKRTYKAVELKCEALDIDTEHGVLRVTGTTDRIRVLPDGREGISDLKSGKAAVGADGRATTKSHHFQLGIYTLMAQQEAGRPMTAPAEIIGLQTTKQARVGAGEVADVLTPLLGDEEHPGAIQIAAQMVRSGLFPPNPKSNLCSAKYCPAFARCHYHD
jgi:hypothetical protein